MFNSFKRSIKAEVLENIVMRITETVGPLELKDVKNHFHHNIKIYKTAVETEP